MQLEGVRQPLLGVVYSSITWANPSIELRFIFLALVRHSEEVFILVIWGECYPESVELLPGFLKPSPSVSVHSTM